MAVLSFFFPIVGWILAGVKKNSNPEMSHTCFKWAWIGFGVAAALGILWMILLVAGLAAVGSM